MEIIWVHELKTINNFLLLKKNKLIKREGKHHPEMDGAYDLLKRTQNLSARLSIDKNSTGWLFLTSVSAFKAKYGPSGENPEENTKDDQRSRKYVIRANVDLRLFGLQRNTKHHAFRCHFNLLSPQQINFCYIYIQLLGNTFNYLPLGNEKQKAKIIRCHPNGQCEKKWAAAGRIQVRLYVKFANKKDCEVLEQSA